MVFFYRLSLSPMQMRFEAGDALKSILAYANKTEDKRRKSSNTVDVRLLS